MGLEWPHQIDAVLLDHDDTLVNTFTACLELNKHVGRTWYGKELTDQDIQDNWHVPFAESVRRIFGTDDPDLAQQRILECYPLYPKKLIGKTVTKRLKAASLFVGIVSSSAKELVEFDLARAKLRGDIDYLQTAEDTSCHKPNPGVFKPATAWLKRYGVLPCHTLYVGDTLNDARATLLTGFAFMGVETGAFTADDFADAGFNSVPTVEYIPRLLGL